MDCMWVIPDPSQQGAFLSFQLYLTTDPLEPPKDIAVALLLVCIPDFLSWNMFSSLTGKYYSCIKLCLIPPCWDSCPRPHSIFLYFFTSSFTWWASPIAQQVKNLPAMQEVWEMQVWFPGREEPLQEETTSYSSIFAWEILRTEEPGGLQSKGLQREGHDWARAGLSHDLSASGSACWTAHPLRAEPRTYSL